MKSIFCLIITCLTLSTVLFAQEGKSDSLNLSLEHLKTYHEKFPEEGIYLHFDKPYYAVGDVIWFKAYVTLGDENLLSAFSKILYVDLLEEHGKTIRSLRLPVTAGISIGDFALDDSLASGIYTIRAYTQWMRNFSKEHIYEKNIAIGRLDQLSQAEVTSNPSATTSKSSQKGSTIPESDIQIFPEGGTFQQGVENDVFVQIPEQAEAGLKGRVLDQDGGVIDVFDINAKGWGVFQFLPQANQAYKIVVEGRNGKILESGFQTDSLLSYALKINNFIPGDVIMQLSVTDTRKLNQAIYLVVQHKGKVFYASKAVPTDKELIVRIPKANLGTGVREVSLFSADMQPLLSRSFFIDHESKYLPLEVVFDKAVYDTHDKIRVEITAGSEMDSLRISSLSAAIVNITQAPVDSLNEENIYSRVLLGRTGSMVLPQMAGAEHVFEQSRELDRYMLSYSRENVWSRMDSSQTVYPIEQDMQVRGQITRYNGKPEPQAKVTLFSPSAGIMIDTVADENGRFAFDRLLFYDSVTFVIQGRTQKGKKNVEIHLDDIPGKFVESQGAQHKLSVNANEKLMAYLQQNIDYYKQLYQSGKLGNSILLNEVQVTTSRENFEHSSNLNGAGNADQIIRAEDLSTCSDLATCLMGRLTGVMFRNGIPYSTRSDNIPMQIIVDGMPMEPDELSMIAPMDVDYIEVLRTIGTTAVYGSMGSGGVLLITTKQGVDRSKRHIFTPGVVTYSPQGFYQIQAFPETNPELMDPTFDKRTTIFWKPDIVTDESGKSYFEFFAGGQPGTYRIVLEGMDLQGRLGRHVSTVEVR